MTQGLSEDTNKKLVELNKVEENMNELFSKELESKEMFQSKIQKIKSDMSTRNNQSGDKISELEDSNIFRGQLPKHA